VGHIIRQALLYLTLGLTPFPFRRPQNGSFIAWVIAQRVVPPVVVAITILSPALLAVLSQRYIVRDSTFGTIEG
jgi:hypothetical protein